MVGFEIWLYPLVTDMVSLTDWVLASPVRHVTSLNPGQKQLDNLGLQINACSSYICLKI